MNSNQQMLLNAADNVRLEMPRLSTQIAKTVDRVIAALRKDGGRKLVFV